MELVDDSLAANMSTATFGFLINILFHYLFICSWTSLSASQLTFFLYKAYKISMLITIFSSYYNIPKYVSQTFCVIRICVHEAIASVSQSSQICKSDLRHISLAQLKKKNLVWIEQSVRVV